MVWLVAAIFGLVAVYAWCRGSGFGRFVVFTALAAVLGIGGAILFCGCMGHNELVALLGGASGATLAWFLSGIPIYCQRLIEEDCRFAADRAAAYLAPSASVRSAQTQVTQGRSWQ